MNKYHFLILTVLLLIISSLSTAADWEYLIQDNNGDSHYIDLESIENTPSGTTIITKKTEPGSSNEYSALVSRIEMDCKGGRIRTLKETSFAINGNEKTVLENGKWKTIRQEDIDELVLELICSLKKSRRDPAVITH